MKRRIAAALLVSVVLCLFSGCAGVSGAGETETFTVRELALWYLASDNTKDCSGAIRAYSTDEYRSLYLWAQNNVGNYLTDAGRDEDDNIVLTMNRSQKEKLLAVVEKKYRQALAELPGVCDLFERAETSENDPRELDIYFDPDAWLGTDTFSIAGMMNFENLIILQDFWQLMEELENGSDFVGTVVWKNANTGFSLLSFSSDPGVESSFSAANAAIRHTNYADYEGKLEFTASYIGEFTDAGYDGTFHEFEITNDTSYEKGEKVCFRADPLPVDVQEGDTVCVSFSGDNAPHEYAFSSHEQELCFDDEIPYEMSLTDPAQ